MTPTTQSRWPTVTEVHKDCMTELFGKTKTPKEIGEAHDAAMKAELAK